MTRPTAVQHGGPGRTAREFRGLACSTTYADPGRPDRPRHTHPNGADGLEGRCSRRRTFRSVSTRQAPPQLSAGVRSPRRAPRPDHQPSGGRSRMATQLGWRERGQRNRLPAQPSPTRSASQARKDRRAMERDPDGKGAAVPPLRGPCAAAMGRGVRHALNLVVKHAVRRR